MEKGKAKPLPLINWKNSPNVYEPAPCNRQMQRVMCSNIPNNMYYDCCDEVNYNGQLTQVAEKTAQSASAAPVKKIPGIVINLRRK